MSIFYVPVRIVPPVADVLAHGPPIPLIIDRIYLHEITAQDKEDILLALKHRDRIRRIRLQIPVPDLETLIVAVAMDGEFLMLMLEFLSVTLQWPQTFTLYEVDAPIDLSCATSTPPHAIGCRLSDNIPITTSPASLVSLSLRWVRPSTFLLPDPDGRITPTTFIRSSARGAPDQLRLVRFR